MKMRKKLTSAAVGHRSSSLPLRVDRFVSGFRDTDFCRARRTEGDRLSGESSLVIRAEWIKRSTIVSRLKTGKPG